MAEFNRTATILAALDGMGIGDLNEITGLRVTGVDREELLEEVRHLVRDAYGNGMSDAADIWTDANVIPHDDEGLIRYFAAVEAAQSVPLGDLAFKTHSSVMYAVAAALDFVYSDGVTLLVEHLEGLADQAESDHEDDEDEDDGDHGDGAEGGQDTPAAPAPASVPGRDPDDWV